MKKCVCCYTNFEVLVYKCFIINLFHGMSCIINAASVFVVCLSPVLTRHAV